MTDVIIIGAGPSGLTAAMYCARSGKNVIVFEGGAYGGQAVLTEKIENYPAFPEGISGIELGERLKNQAIAHGAKLRHERVKEIWLKEKTVITRKGSYSAKNIILAMGASPKPLGVKGENEFKGRGVSYCAVCDGGFYKDKTAVVIGGSDTAVHDCQYLSGVCKKVYLIHRRNELRGGEAALKRVSLPNVEILWNSNAQEFLGNDKITGVRLADGRIIEADGIFVAVGTTPQSALVEGQLDMENGYIVTDEKMETSVGGVYAAGDIRKKTLRQVITAASDGAIAAESIH